MKTIVIILAISAVAWAADQEVLTLKDGRQLTGIYDAKAGVLDMGMAKITVADADIAERRKAKPSEAPAAPADDGLIDTKSKVATPEEAAKRVAAIDRVLATYDERVSKARASVETDRREVADAERNPDLRAYADGAAERGRARTEGGEACRKQYKDASPKLVDQWEDRFEAQVADRQKKTVAKAEAKLRTARADAKRSQDALDAAIAKRAELSAARDDAAKLAAR